MKNSPHHIVCQSVFGLHPATCLVICCLLLVSLSWLNALTLVIIFAITLMILSVFRVRQFLSLCYKSRFLLIITSLLFAWQTPGKLVFAVTSPALGSFLPTIEGIRLACEHLMLLLLFIAIVSLCLRLLDRNQWVAGLYRILCWLPFVNAKAFSVQFMLALEQLVNLPALSLANFRQLLNPQTIPDQALPTTFILKEPRMIWADYAAMILAVSGAFCLWQIQ